MAASSSLEDLVNIPQIAVDLFIYKKLLDKHGALTITDACGDLVFKVDDDGGGGVGGGSSKSSSKRVKVLRDTTGNPIISIKRTEGGWEGFKGEDLFFKVGRSSKSSSSSRRRRELEVVLVGENECDSESSEFKVRGCPFYRSCTIYKDNSIVAQTSLLYKLGKVIVGRRRFRLTIFPGFLDKALFVALVAVFLD